MENPKGEDLHLSLARKMEKTYKIRVGTPLSWLWAMGISSQQLDASGTPQNHFAIVSRHFSLFHNVSYVCPPFKDVWRNLQRKFDEFPNEQMPSIHFLEMFGSMGQGFLSL